MYQETGHRSTDFDVLCVDEILKRCILRTISHYYNFNIIVFSLTFLFAYGK
jgi:hypothetical protein